MRQKALRALPFVLVLLRFFCVQKFFSWTKIGIIWYQSVSEESENESSDEDRRHVAFYITSLHTFLYTLPNRLFDDINQKLKLMELKVNQTKWQKNMVSA